MSGARYAVLATHKGDVAYVACDLLGHMVVLVADAYMSEKPATWDTREAAEAMATRVASLDPSLLPLTVIDL